MRKGQGRCLRWMVMAWLLLGCRGAWATEPGDAEPGLTARFLPDSALVGGRVDLLLAYRLPEGAHPTPSPRIGGLDGLLVEGIEKTADGIRVRLLVDRLGRLTTGPLTFAYLSGDGKEAFLKADPVTLTVLTNLKGRPEEAQLRPIRDIIPVRSRLMTSLPWVLGALAASGAGLGILLWLQRRSRRASLVRPGVPPHRTAERELRELASLELFEKGRVKEFYFIFSEILRRYLENLRGFPAAEYTTQEIALAVEMPEDRGVLPLLQDADMVKFAGFKPMAAKKEEDMGSALAYIRETGTVFERPDGENASPPRAVGFIRRGILKKGTGGS